MNRPETDSLSRGISPRERMVRACRGEPVDRVPVWLMRQAGRYLPEYRAMKQRSSFLEMCRDPQLVTEVALQPFRRFAMDGVIVFSDILVPLTGLDIRLDFRPGPEVDNPIESENDLKRLDGSVASAVEPACKAIEALRAELGNRAAVLGFAGAPWTLAAYACEHKLSRDLAVLGGLSYREPKLLERLLMRMAEITAETLTLQIEAGADVVQIFDTWAGMLSKERFERFARPALQHVLERLPEPRPPVILFARGAAHLIEPMAEIGADVISLDWRVNLTQAAQQIGDRVSLQGNLDPVALLGPADEIRKRARALIEAGRGARGHILNLGHGILPMTPVDAVGAFVNAARSGSPP